MANNVSVLLINISANLQHLQTALEATGGVLTLHKCSVSVVSTDTSVATDVQNLSVKIRRTEKVRDLVIEAAKVFFSKPIPRTKHELEVVMRTPLPTTPREEQIKHVNEIADNIELRFIPQHTGQKSLGQWYQTNGGQSTIELVMRKINSTFIQRIGNTDLSSAQIMDALISYHLPKLLFKFHGSYPDHEFLDRETNRLITSLLPSIGMNRHTPLAIRHSPEDILGFNLPRLLCEAGIIHIKD